MEESNLTVQVSALRKLLGAESISTVPGRGYRFTLMPDGPRTTTLLPATAATSSGAVGGATDDDAAAIAAPRSAGPGSAATALALPDKPSIAVLPFANLSADPEQEFFTEDIISDLSRFRSLFVIARAIAAEIAPQIGMAEIAKTRRKRPESLSGYELAIRARDFSSAVLRTEAQRGATECRPPPAPSPPTAPRAWPTLSAGCCCSIRWDRFPGTKH